MEFGDRDLSSAIVLLTRGLDDGDPHAAVAWLGHRRGLDGVGLSDAFDDLTTAYRLAAGEDPPAGDLKTLATAWAEGAVAALQTRGALDSMTGLATRDYLATRLRDLARLGQAAAHQLIVIGPGPQRHRLAAILRASRIAKELVESFHAAETPTQLAGDRIGVIVAVDDSREAALAGLRRAVARIDGALPESREHTPAELRAIELPTEADAVSAFLESL